MKAFQGVAGRRSAGAPDFHAVGIVLTEDEAEEIVSVLRSSAQSCPASISLEEILSSVALGEQDGTTR